MFLVGITCHLPAINADEDDDVQMCKCANVRMCKWGRLCADEEDYVRMCKCADVQMKMVMCKWRLYS